MKNQSLIARIFLWKRFSSFTYLNTTQFLVTINDSVFRLLVVFYLISRLGEAQSSNIIFISGVLFVAPFLVFSMPAGELADKFCKMKVMAWTLVLEILAMLYGIYAMIWCSQFNAYAALFCVALQASLFLPSKYAILPEIVKKEELSKANGYMTLATYVAIILGTFLASFFTQITNNNYAAVACFCLILAVLGFYTSLQVEKTPAKNPEKTVKVLFLIQVFKSLKLAKQYPHLLLTVIAGAYFIYTASFTQLNIIPYGIQSLKITDVQAGYVFLAAALGVGIGSLTVALVSGKNVELGISIWGAFGTSFSYIILFLFSKSIFIAVLMILSLGIHGGLYIVPIDAYIQMASPDKDRGEIVAAGTFLGFVGVFLAALSIGFFSNVLKISAAEGYLIIGLLSLVISVIITFLLPEYFSRILAVTFFKSFFNLNLHNQPHTEFYESVIVVCRKYTFLHILSLIFLYPRLGFVRLSNKKPFFLFRPFYHLLHIIPFPISNPQEFKGKIQQAINKKMPLCLFLEGRKNMPSDEKYQEAINLFLNEAKTSHLFLHIYKKDTFNEKKGIFSILKVLPTQVEAQFSSKDTSPLNYQGAIDQMSKVETQPG